MSDALFPSGPWTGFYNYSPKHKHRMDLALSFAAGKMTGDGNDDIGRFMIRGQYDEKSLECSWIKTYVGAHDVFYRGFREGKGIWGTWEITPYCHGGFHIWPKRVGQGDAEAATEEQAVPVTETAAEIEKRELVVKGLKVAKSPPRALGCADLSALCTDDLSPSTPVSTTSLVCAPRCET